MSNTNPLPSPGPAIVAPLSRFLAVASIPESLAFYRDVLGFEVRSVREENGIGSCYIYVNDADTLHAELSSRGANVLGEPVSHPWGLRDFSVFDLEGNQITFGQPFE